MNATFHRIFFLSLLSLWTVQNVHAQRDVVAAGSDATGPGGSVSYSIGQVSYTTDTASGGTVSQGVQQAYEIFIVAGVEETGIELSASVYPNPTFNEVVLKVTDQFMINTTCTLTDANGKTIYTRTIVADQTRMALSDLPSGIYLLNISDHKSLLKTFRIVKNN